MRHRRRNASIAVVALAAIAIGTTTFAQDGGEGGSDGSSTAEPGTPYVDPGSGDLTESDVPEDIVTSSSTFDPTVLTKFVSARSFTAHQGQATGVDDDRVGYDGLQCVTPVADGGGGSLTNLNAGVELPDGARIKQLIFYGEDSYAPANIEISLQRVNFGSGIVIGPPTRSDEQVTVFTTAAATGNTATASADNLNEIVGSFSSGFPLLTFNHRFHSIRIIASTAATNTHVICGVEVQYQVPMSTADPGTVFHPIDPIRVYDSRQAPYAPNNGTLGPNQSRIVSIKDARDTGGNLTAADVIPAGATAITYNITVASPTGPNFLAVTPGDVGSFTASAINFNGTADVANAATTKIAADRTIKVWGGDQSGSMHFLIDVTGYYSAPVAPPNMGN